MIRRFHEAKINKSPDVIVWGTGKPRREFLYVDDLAEACVLLMNIDKSKYDKIIDKMMLSRNWTQSRYYGQTKKEIKKMWSDNGKKASEAGTKMHYDIECYYNDEAVEIEEDCVEWSYFENFENAKTVTHVNQHYFKLSSLKLFYKT